MAPDYAILRFMLIACGDTPRLTVNVVYGAIRLAAPTAPFLIGKVITTPVRVQRGE
jgi:hypothetical protein